MKGLKFESIYKKMIMLLITYVMLITLMVTCQQVCTHVISSKQFDWAVTFLRVRYNLRIFHWNPYPSSCLLVVDWTVSRGQWRYWCVAKVLHSSPLLLIFLMRICLLVMAWWTLMDFNVFDSWIRVLLTSLEKYLILGEFLKELCRLPMLVSEQNADELDHEYLELPIFGRSILLGEGLEYNYLYYTRSLQYNYQSYFQPSILLYNNTINSSIPTEIGQLKLLLRLALNDNQCSATFQIKYLT